MSENNLFNLKLAINESNIEKVRLNKHILKHMDNKVYNTCFLGSIVSGNLEILKLIVEEEPKGYTYFNNNLGMACVNGHLRIVEYLILEKKLDPNYENETPLWNALCSNKYDVSYYLLENHVKDYSEFLFHVGLNAYQKDWLKNYEQIKKTKEKLSKELQKKDANLNIKKSKV